MSGVHSTVSEPTRSPEAYGKLFGALPPDLFRLLSGSQRWFYADLLEHLDRELFAMAAGPVRWHDVLAAISEFVDRQDRAALIMAEELMPDEAAAVPPGASRSAAHIAYARLVSTGWLVEYRDRYRRLADVDGAARLLLDLLLEMKNGLTRSYGGEVLGVLSALENARDHPQDRSESLRNAARLSRSFLGHLRSVASAMRTVEEEMLRQSQLSAMFRSFFEDFVARHLVEDFKRLHTASNPFRFRSNIVECAEEMMANRLLVEELGDGYVREGRARDADRAYEIIDGELREVLRVFAAIDDHLEIIEDIGRAMERRLRNTVRHLDRVSSADVSAVTAAMVALARKDVELVPPGPLRLLIPSPPLDPAHMFLPPRRRAPIDRKPITESPPDPAYLAYREAVDRFREQMVPTPERINAYLSAAMKGRMEMTVDELPLNSLEDFVVVDRLPFLQWLDVPDLSGAFTVEMIPGPLFSNDWISCARFRVHRVIAKAQHDA